MLEVDLPNEIIKCGFAWSVDRIRWRPKLHAADAGGRGADGQKFALLALLQKGPAGLEQSQRAKRVDLEMLTQVGDGGICRPGIDLGNPGICNYNVELVDAVRNLQFSDGSGGRG